MKPKPLVSEHKNRSALHSDNKPEIKDNIKKMQLVAEDVGLTI